MEMLVVTILQPVLHADRLSLVPFAPPLAHAMLALQISNRAHFAPWDPAPGAQFYTVAFWSARMRLRAQDWLDGRGASYLLFLKDQPEQLIGSISLGNMVRGVLQAATLGYAIDQDYQGQGLMREAAETLIRFAFDVLHLHRIQANYQPHNQRSAALLARLGFCIEGRASNYLYLNGAWRDHVLTSLTNPQFNPAHLLL
jgi:ribosomal-protein-alanine N-acetyltransferase